MATTVSLDIPSPLEDTTTHGLMESTADAIAKRSVPRPIPAPVLIPPRTERSSVDHSSGKPSPQPSPRLHASPLPMPDFVFPARPSPSSAPSSLSRATGRRPKSVADFGERSSPLLAPSRPDVARPSRSPALPTFSFNPGADLPPPPSHPFLSPLQSPQSPRAIPARPSGAGHRRGGSEFVGGNLRSGEAFTVMSTSPTKSDSGISSPSLSATSGPGPTQGRRGGHAHRRSAAISSHDLSVILQPSSPNPPARGSSAPASPADFNRSEGAYKFPETIGDKENLAAPVKLADTAVVDEVPQPVVSPTPVVAAEEPQASAQTTARPNNRARVGFSDTLEFIPRPLSLVSSDTSSTITARPGTGATGGGHSVSGSISSIISLSTTASPMADREPISPLVQSPSRDTAADSRPSTAGAVLDRAANATAEGEDAASPRRRNSIPILTTIPLSTDGTEPEGTGPQPSPSKTPKRWSFFGLDPFIGNGSSSSLTRQRPASSGSGETGEAAPRSENGSVSTAKEEEPKPAIANVVPTTEMTPTPAKATVTRNTSNKKKKKKVRTWGILRRKSKPRRKSRRAPTPPPVHMTTEDVSNESLSAPTVFVTPSESPIEARDPQSVWETIPSTTPTTASAPTVSEGDDDNSVAIIDLDAALGPFNTPLPRNPEWEAAQRAGALAKRQLHSAAGMSRFTGPGMHYSHRRAESAPEMPPFNRAGIPRFGSSTAMADVFEEEEEEDEEEERAKSQQGGSKAVSVRSGSSTTSTSGPPQSADKVEGPASIDIRVTNAEANGHEFVFPGSAERIPDMSNSLSDDAMSSLAQSRPSSGVSGLSDDDKTQPSSGLKSEYSASSLHDDVIVEEDPNGMFFGAPDDDCDIAVESSSDSTVNSPSRLMKGKDLAPVGVSPLDLPTSTLAPVSPGSVSHSSSFPSPLSPGSYDANRISTAPTSATEDNFQSLLLGEPGPEVRLSCDMPSLTSSNSTMTRESGHAQGAAGSPFGLGPQPRPYLASRGMERPASFTSTAFGRRRSSLASLHRLINSSHGERSKLSAEVPVDTDSHDGSNNSIHSTGDPEKKQTKTSRSKRLSRLMQFWKPKEEASA